MQGLTLDFQLDPSHTPVHNGNTDFLCLILKHFDKIDTEIQTSCCTTENRALLIAIGSIVFGYIQRTHPKPFIASIKNVLNLFPLPRKVDSA